MAEAKGGIENTTRLITQSYTDEYMIRLLPDLVRLPTKKISRSNVAILFRITKSSHLMTGRAHFYGTAAYGILINDKNCVVGPANLDSLGSDKVTRAILCASDGSILPEVSAERFAQDGQPMRVRVSYAVHRQLQATNETISQSRLDQHERPLDQQQRMQQQRLKHQILQMHMRIRQGYDVRDIDFDMDQTMPSSDQQTASWSPDDEGSGDLVLVVPKQITLQALDCIDDDQEPTYNIAIPPLVNCLDFMVLALGRRPKNTTNNKSKREYTALGRPMVSKIITPPTFYQHGYAIPKNLARTMQITPPKPAGQVRKFHLGPVDRVLLNHQFSLQNNEINIHIIEIVDSVKNIVRAIQLE